MSGIDNLTAAQLSSAAYIPTSTYVATNGAPPGALPTGWQADTLRSVTIGDNQFITFVNSDTHQIVVTFKGTNTASQLLSDLTNDAAAQWATLKSAFETQLVDIRSNYPGWEIMTDGHSSGGAMAQTAALENNLSGWGQNSLPIAKITIDRDPQLSDGKLTGAVSDWKAAGNLFHETNEEGDIATQHYSGKFFLYTARRVVYSEARRADWSRRRNPPSCDPAQAAPDVLSGQPSGWCRMVGAGR